jgi:hypothetical protein
MPHKPDRTHEIATVAAEVIQQKIYLIRGHKVMLDRDLAAVYGVQTFRLNEAVKRNIGRFPTDFMFQLTKEESEALISQTAISKTGRGGRRTLPYAFTEQGVAMLATVLNSERAVQMSIAIIRVFVKLREMIATHKDLARALDDLQLKQEEHSEQIAAIIDTINQLLLPEPVPPKRRIGFNAGEGA